jgi:hypothetical protein
MLVAHFRAVPTVSKVLTFVSRTYHACCECCNETKRNVLQLRLYICTRIIGYGQFVYKPTTVVRGTARPNAVYMNARLL